MSSKSLVTEADLADAARSRATAEAEECRRMLAFHDAEVAKAESIESPLRRQAEKSFIPLTIGQAMGLSEGQVCHRLSMARRVRDRAPQTWRAFVDGRVNEPRIREISSTIERLEREESVARLDQRVVDYAQTHTLAELRAWLRRFVVRVEGDLAAERAESERADRQVEILHGDEGMSQMFAKLPSYVLAAIGKRLDKEARALGADDPRSLAQRRADLFASWLTTNENGEAAVNADIAVTIAADVLAGATEGFGISADGQWVMPAAWLAELAAAGDPFWHKMVLEPVTHDVLAHEYLGRFAPSILAKAIAFRDGVCEAPGCLVPADRCDIDHRQPWPEGPTSGANLGPKCRKHHIGKGFGLLPASPRKHAA
jgi:hypothetical protein